MACFYHCKMLLTKKINGNFISWKNKATFVRFELLTLYSEIFRHVR